MAISIEQSEPLEGLAKQILHSFDLVESSATKLLQEKHQSKNDVFAVPENTMVGRANAAPQLNRIQQGVIESLSSLLREPFIAYVLAEDDEGIKHKIYFARSYALVDVPGLDGRLVNYRALLGRLAEVDRGDSIDLKLPSGSTTTYTIIERMQLRPCHDNSQWDGIQNRIDAEYACVTIKSLIEYLNQIAAAEIEPEDFFGKIFSNAQVASTVLEGNRRRIIERMSLRDQPILDKFQGEIFRLSLNKRLILTGPAGTGKTTTLIRRLAQKRSIDEIDAEEKAQVPAIHFHPDNWIMFTPTTLLKLYLKEAFSREGVAASDDRVRTWADERRRLGREIFKILRSERGGQFTLDDEIQILKSSYSSDLINITDAFEEYFKKKILTQYEDILESIRMSPDRDLLVLINQMIRSAGGNALVFENLFGFFPFHEEISKHIGKYDKTVREMRKLSINVQLYRDRNFLEHLSDFLNSINVLAADDEEDDDTDIEEDSVITINDRRLLAEKAYWRAIAVLAISSENGNPIPLESKNGKILEWLKVDLATDKNIRTLGPILIALKQLRFLSNTFRNLVDKIPGVYQQFRRACVKEGIWFRSDGKSAIDRKRITGLETDMLILVMLRNARGFFPSNAETRLDEHTGTGALPIIRDEYVTQVLVDEATDFSAVQLACMLELANPAFRSLFASGDVRQRITAWGVRNLDELQWVASDFEVRQIGCCYRQSRQLAALASKVASLDDNVAPAIQVQDYIDDASVPVILGENLQGEDLGRWLCERIVEIEQNLAKVPSVAIFVNGEGRIDPLLSSLRPLLAEHNLDVVGCREGLVVGMENQIRIFDVQHIKGLEFEAVFFVGIDALAVHRPEEFAHFLYVGITRAATYLGITCEKSLPVSLETLRADFVCGTWDAKKVSTIEV